MPEDNRFILFPSDAGNRHVVLVGQETYYWQKALEAYPNITLDTVSTPVDGLQGFDLYIYEGALPETLPVDGTVWAVDLAKGVQTDRFSFTVGDEVRGTVGLRQAPELDAGIADRMIKNLNLKRIGLYSMMEIQEYQGLVPVLLCGDMPVLLVNTTGQRPDFVLIPFDLHRSNLPVLNDYLLLLDSLLKETVPVLHVNPEVRCAETLILPVHGSADAVHLMTPSGERIQLHPEQGQVSVRPEEPGVYTLTEELGSRSRTQHFFCRIPEGESRAPEMLARDAATLLHPLREDEEEQRLWDPSLLLAVLVMILLALEYGVYRYERL